MTLLELFQLLKKHLQLVVVLPVACALVMAVASIAVMRNTYTAQTSMYILSTASAAQGQTTNYTLDRVFASGQRRRRPVGERPR